MVAITFDTLKFVEKLKVAGVPEPQAKAICEAQSEVFSEVTESTLATKADVFAVKAEIIAVKADVVAIKADIFALKESTKADILAVKSDVFVLKGDVQQVKTEIVEVKSRLRVTEWMLGFIVAGVSALVLKAFF